MAGIRAMGDISHELESLLAAVEVGSVHADAAAFDVLQESLDELHRMREMANFGQRILRRPVCWPGFAALASQRHEPVERDRSAALLPRDSIPLQERAMDAGVTSRRIADMEPPGSNQLPPTQRADPSSAAAVVVIELATRSKRPSPKPTSLGRRFARADVETRRADEHCDRGARPETAVKPSPPARQPRPASREPSSNPYRPPRVAAAHAGVHRAAARLEDAAEPLDFGAREYEELPAFVP